MTFTADAPHELLALSQTEVFKNYTVDIPEDKIDKILRDIVEFDFVIGATKDPSVMTFISIIKTPKGERSTGRTTHIAGVVLQQIKDFSFAVTFLKVYNDLYVKDLQETKSSSEVFIENLYKSLIGLSDRELEKVQINSDALNNDGTNVESITLAQAVELLGGTEPDDDKLLTFSEVLSLLEAGESVSRKSWNNLDKYIFLNDGIESAPIFYDKHGNEIYPTIRQLLFLHEYDKLTQYHASSKDLFARDWILVTH